MKVAVLRTPASVHDMMSLLSISGLESQKVSYGLRISRLSKDLYELLTELDLNDVALPGHSMGSSLGTEGSPSENSHFHPLVIGPEEHI